MGAVDPWHARSCREDVSIWGAEDQSRSRAHGGEPRAKGRIAVNAVTRASRRPRGGKAGSRQDYPAWERPRRAAPWTRVQVLCAARRACQTRATCAGSDMTTTPARLAEVK